MNKWIHHSSFLFPAELTDWYWGPKEAKNPAENVLRLIQIFLIAGVFMKTARDCLVGCDLLVV